MIFSKCCKEGQLNVAFENNNEKIEWRQKVIRFGLERWDLLENEEECPFCHKKPTLFESRC